MSENKKMVIRAAMEQSYELGFDAASKLYAEIFEKAGMDDAAMMVRGSNATRKGLLENPT